MLLLLTAVAIAEAFDALVVGGVVMGLNWRIVAPLFMLGLSLAAFLAMVIVWWRNRP